MSALAGSTSNSRSLWASLTQGSPPGTRLMRSPGPKPSRPPKPCKATVPSSVSTASAPSGSTPTWKVASDASTRRSPFRTPRVPSPARTTARALPPSNSTSTPSSSAPRTFRLDRSSKTIDDASPKARTACPPSLAMTRSPGSRNCPRTAAPEPSRLWISTSPETRCRLMAPTLSSSNRAT